MAFSFGEISYEIETHPMIVAIAIGAVVFFGYNVFTKNKQAVASVGATLPSAPATATLGGPETFNQQFNSFPLVQSPTGTSIGTTPTAGIVPAGHPPIVPVSHPPIIVVPPVPPPTATSAKYQKVTTWPEPYSSLWSIAILHGVSLAVVERLNPQYSNNWNLVRTGDMVRYA